MLHQLWGVGSSTSLPTYLEVTLIFSNESNNFPFWRCSADDTCMYMRLAEECWSNPISEYYISSRISQHYLIRNIYIHVIEFMSDSHQWLLIGLVILSMQDDPRLTVFISSLFFGIRFLLIGSTIISFIQEICIWMCSFLYSVKCTNFLYERNRLLTVI